MGSVNYQYCIWHMLPAKNLGANLRFLCQHKGSISSICRALNLNRQQFNKYLSGHSLPNPATLRKICSYFGVSEESLLQNPALVRTELKDQAALVQGRTGAKAGAFKLLEDILGSAETSLEPGFYYAYYPWTRDPDKAIRSLVIVELKSGHTLFRRYTSLREAGTATKYYHIGRYRGIVIEEQNTLFFLARNRMGFRDISLMSFQKIMPNSVKLMVGVALVMAPWGPMASRVTLEYAGASLNFREALNDCCILELNSDAIDPIVRSSILSSNDLVTPQLMPFSLLHNWSLFNDLALQTR
jgi:transcriptional regulator with XRE-family HTH domain